jgi:hypothetical protein
MVIYETNRNGHLTVFHQAQLGAAGQIARASC